MCATTIRRDRRFARPDQAVLDLVDAAKHAHYPTQSDWSDERASSAGLDRNDRWNQEGFVMRKYRQLAWLSFVVALLIGACGGSPDGAGTTGADTTGDPIIIGRPEGQTGYLQLYDGPVTQAIRLAIDDVNAEGGVLGRPLELITADTKTDIALVPTVALDIIEQGVDILIPTWDYDLGGPAARLAMEHGMLAIAGASSPNYGLEGIGRLFFNVENGSPTEGGTIAEWSYIQREWRRPYVLTDTSIEYSKKACEFFEKRWTELAGEGSLAGEDTFDNADPAIPAQVARLQAASDADFIVLCSYPPGGASAVKQIRDAGITLPIFGSGNGMDGDYWLDSVPNLSDFYVNVGGSLFGDDPDPAINELFDRIEEAQGERPVSSLALQGYAAIQLLVKAIEDVGSCCDAEALASAMEGFRDVETVVGPITFTDECHIAGGRRVRIIEVTDGEPEYLETWEVLKVPESTC